MEPKPHGPALARLAQTRPRLAKIFAQDWLTPLSKYGAELYHVQPQTLPPDFLELFEGELIEAGWGTPLAKAAASQLARLPVIQTSHHLTPTHGPTFSTIDLISLAGLPENQLYLIGAASGVSFSNTAWSGALSYGDLELETLLQPGPWKTQAQQAAVERAAHGEMEQRLSLIGARWRDQLVYGSPLPEDLNLRLAQLQPAVKELMAPPRLGERYSHWAARNAARLQEKLFNGAKLVIFDLNRLAGLFLAKRIEDKDPFFLELLQGEWQDPDFNFLVGYPGKKSNKLLLARWNGLGLYSERQGLEPLSPEALAQAIKDGRVCPGTWISFLILRFYLGLECLGSFNQIDYLDTWRQRLQSSPLKAELHLGPSPGLTTGRWHSPQGLIWPLDWALRSQTLEPKALSTLTMGELWQATLTQLAP